MRKARAKHAQSTRKARAKHAQCTRRSHTRVARTHARDIAHASCHEGCLGVTQCCLGVTHTAARCGSCHAPRIPPSHPRLNPRRCGLPVARSNAILALRPFRAVASSPAPPSDGLVLRSEFRSLLAHLCIYARMHEVFLLVDAPPDVDARPDHRLTAEELTRAAPALEAAAKTWAPFQALANCTAADFDTVRTQRARNAHATRTQRARNAHAMRTQRARNAPTVVAHLSATCAQIDANKGGMVDLSEWCEWLAAAERACGTEMGTELAGTRSEVSAYC